MPGDDNDTAFARNRYYRRQIPSEKMSIGNVYFRNGFNDVSVHVRAKSAY